MSMLYIILFFLCTHKVYCEQENCSRETISGSKQYFCCANFELMNGNCVECQTGFTSLNGLPCNVCSVNKYGYRCAFDCYCLSHQICHNVKGCIKVTSNETLTTTDDPVGGTSLSEWISTADIQNKNGIARIHMIMLCVGFSSIVLILPLSVSLICLCLKYELSCKKRKHVTVFSDTFTPNETANQSQPGVSHQYDEVDEGFLYRESSIKNEKDASSSDSSTVRSGICGTDSEGYLNPYHTILTKEIALWQGPYSELSDTEISFSHAQGVIKHGKKCTEDTVFLNRKSSIHAIQNVQDVRCDGSSRTGSGICGTDNEGYLNPYHALHCTEINLTQGPYCKLSDTETDV